MTIIKNILIFLVIVVGTVFLLFGTFIFGKSPESKIRIQGDHSIKKTIVTVAIDPKGVESLEYSPYKSGVTSSGILNLDFGRLATAFILSNSGNYIAFSGSNMLIFENLQGIISLYDPFSIYSFSPKNQTYQIDQITNGSFYISDEQDGTVSLYSIDAVVKLSFFSNKNKMTDMILFPGMYIKFDPQANNLLRDADLFKIMLVLSDINNLKVTGLEFVNPRVSDGTGKPVFFMYKLPVVTKPLFRILNILFADRIKQIENLKKYTNNTAYSGSDTNSLIHNPSKKNHYLLEELKSILSLTIQSQMETEDIEKFSKKIKNMHAESKLLVDGNSITTTLQGFLTDTRFVLFSKNSNPKFSDIYAETAKILGVEPNSGKGLLFQSLSDIYSRNIALPKLDPTFSSIDTYTPTAEELLRTIDNNSGNTIESKDYFDVALYAYQLLKKAQDGELLTDESLESKATYDLINTLFLATEKYIQGIKEEKDKKNAYQTLIIQFYLPTADTITRSFYKKYISNIDNKVFLDSQYLDGDTIKIKTDKQNYINSSYDILKHTYDKISRFFEDQEKPDSVISFRDSVLRMEGLKEIVKEGNYKEYRQTPYIGTDIDGYFLPEVNLDGVLEKYKAPSTKTIRVIPQTDNPPINDITSDSTTDIPATPNE